jgi:hypothetical protein
MKRKEHDNVSDDDSEDHDELNYKPRPQLPKPFVCMRSLADLIRKRACREACKILTHKQGISIVDSLTFLPSTNVKSCGQPTA